MQAFIIDFLNKFGYFGIAFLIAIENIFPPIPSEIILTFSGFMTTYTSMKIGLVILYATIGSVVGAIILYIIGRILNVERLERILDGKIGKILRLKKEDVEKANKWFTKHGKKTVFFCRFIPIVRSLISIPAGISKMKFRVFLILTTIGTLIWNTVLILLGRLAGDTWEKIAGYFDVYSTIALIVILVVCGIVGLIFIKMRFLNKKGDKNIKDCDKGNSNQLNSDNNTEFENSNKDNSCNNSCNVNANNNIAINNINAIVDDYTINKINEKDKMNTNLETEKNKSNNKIQTCETKIITKDIKDNEN